MFLNAAKFQGYSFYRFWVINGKPTGGVKIIPSSRPPTEIRVKGLTQSQIISYILFDLTECNQLKFFFAINQMGNVWLFFWFFRIVKKYLPIWDHCIPILMCFRQQNHKILPELWWSYGVNCNLLDGLMLIRYILSLSPWSSAYSSVHKVYSEFQVWLFDNLRFFKIHFLATLNSNYFYLQSSCILSFYRPNFLNQNVYVKTDTCSSHIVMEIRVQLTSFTLVNFRLVQLRFSAYVLISAWKLIESKACVPSFIPIFVYITYGELSRSLGTKNNICSFYKWNFFFF